MSITADIQARTPLDEALRGALRNVPASVAVITAGAGDASFGITATSVTSVSMSPPAMLACVYRAARMNAALRDSGRFRISYLHREQENIAAAFAGGGPASARFTIGDWDVEAPDAPRLRDALLDIVCRLENSVDVGTHTVFIGHVEAVQVGAGEPLLYCNGLYSGLAGQLGS